MNAPLRILAIPGSLRARSTNLLLLETVAALADKNTRVEFFSELAEIPLFNPDTTDIPFAVLRLRAAIQATDAVIFSAPEYAHGLPGALKNALDWLVSDIDLTHKPVALFNASARSVYAQTALREVLITMGVRFIDAACVTVPLLAELRTAQKLASESAIAAPIRAALARLSESVTEQNELNAASSQPIGPSIPHWQPRLYPERRTFHGRYCSIEPLDAGKHAEPLYHALCAETGDAGWTYLPVGKPTNPEEWRHQLEQHANNRDALYCTLFDEAGLAAGICAYLRITPQHGVMEIGHIHLSPSLQQKRAATEIQYLLMRHAFDDLGYRRYEWKCDALNAPSRCAAQRFGFRFEGIFLNAIVYKDRSRDTAWFSVIDEEWPRIRHGFAAWLAPENFAADGRQLHSLASLRQEAD